MSIEKLNPDYNLEKARLQQLKSLFPEAVRDGDIDFDVLREVLGLGDDDDSVEHFGLNWAGKRQARKIATKPSKGTLIPVQGEGINEDSTGNIFIEGDNLEVLKLLQKSYAGRIKMIYIDPPYNTGNDFIYKDDYSDSTADYLRKTGQADEKGKLLTSNPKSSGRFHANWLSMMYPRLRVAKNLLTEDGVIFISIDDNEVHNLRALCNEIFGEENYISEFIWEKKFSPQNDAKYISLNHEQILLYAKSKDNFHGNLLPMTDEQRGRYTNPDNDPRGIWVSSDLTVATYSREYDYPIKTPYGDSILPVEGRCWSMPEDKMKAMIEDNRIWFGSRQGSVPRLKKFLSETQQGIVPISILYHKNVGHTQEATKEVKSIFEGYKYFDFPKPSRLIKKLLEISSNTSDIILDFFAGSCTTAQAVMELNKEDGGDRKFICVQIAEETDEKSEAFKAGYKTIAEIGKERIRRAIKKIEEELSGQIELTAKPDLGFKVYKVDQSNLKLWQDYQGTDSQQLGIQFKEFEQPFREEGIADYLFQKYEKTEDCRMRDAIVYLIKNGSRIPKNSFETIKKYKRIKRKLEIKIRKLKKQVEMSIPSGRDLEGEKWLQTLILASNTMPVDQSESDSWFSALKRNSPSIPYPIVYESNEDLTWCLNDQNRICIKFSGLSDHIFQIYCDSRQLPYFRRFYEDQELKKASKDQFSSALFTLRSAMIIWKDDDGKGDLWDKHKLYLHCTFDTDYWTVEGTQAIAQKKREEVLNLIDRMKEKEDLTDTQKAFIQRKQTTLARLNNIFPRPSKPIYQGNPNLFLGVAMGLQEPVTIALVDVTTNKVILYRNIKQLLGDDYHLIRRRRNEKQKLNHQNHKARKRANFQQKGESNLGEYLDRLLAKAILQIAEEYQVSTIIVPRLNHIRSITEAEIQARAEERIPEYKEGQRKYAQDYRVQVHQWSYGRLIDNIKAISSKLGIVVEEGKQPKQGKFTDKALQLALSTQKNNRQNNPTKTNS